nr:hypothetical protein [Deinococcus hopiensis]
MFSNDNCPQNRSNSAIRCSNDWSGLAWSVKAISPTHLDLLPPAVDQTGRESVFSAELSGRLLTPVNLIHDVELELTAVGTSGHTGSFGAVSLRADGDEVLGLLVRS